MSLYWTVAALVFVSLLFVVREKRDDLKKHNQFALAIAVLCFSLGWPVALLGLIVGVLLGKKKPTLTDDQFNAMKKSQSDNRKSGNDSMH